MFHKQDDIFLTSIKKHYSSSVLWNKLFHYIFIFDLHQNIIFK